MLKVNVELKASNPSSYPILIGENLLENAFSYIKKYTKANKFLVVTNTTVDKLYSKYFIADNVYFLVLPDGEIYKNMETLNKILES